MSGNPPLSPAQLSSPLTGGNFGSFPGTPDYGGGHFPLPFLPNSFSNPTTPIHGPLLAWPGSTGRLTDGRGLGTGGGRDRVGTGGGVGESSIPLLAFAPSPQRERTEKHSKFVAGKVVEFEYVLNGSGSGKEAGTSLYCHLRQWMTREKPVIRLPSPTSDSINLSIQPRKRRRSSFDSDDAAQAKKGSTPTAAGDGSEHGRDGKRGKRGSMSRSTSSANSDSRRTDIKAEEGKNHVEVQQGEEEVCRPVTADAVKVKGEDKEEGASYTIEQLRDELLLWAKQKQRAEQKRILEKVESAQLEFIEKGRETRDEYVVNLTPTPAFPREAGGEREEASSAMPSASLSAASTLLGKEIKEEKKLGDEVKHEE